MRSPCSTGASNTWPVMATGASRGGLREDATLLTPGCPANREAEAGRNHPLRHAVALSDEEA
jgi:hypothetical protein